MSLRPDREVGEGPLPVARAATVVALGGCGLVTALALFALAGWITPFRLLPMPPTAAVSFLLAALSLPIVLARSPGSSSSFRSISALLYAFVVLLASGELARFMFGLPLAPDRLLVSDPRVIGVVATGRMSPLTAAGFLLAGASGLLLPARRALSVAGGLVAVAVALLGALVLLGYLYGAPVLYGGATAPMAASAGLGFLLLGVALIAASGRHRLPLRPLVGSSASARLLRVVLLVGAAAILIDALIVTVLPTPSPVLRVAVFGLLLAVALGTGLSSAARNVESSIDRAFEAERALQASEQKLRAFFDSRAVGILFGDSEGAVHDANDAFLEMIGYSRAELENHALRWTDITPPEFLPRDEEAVREARDRGSCRPYEKQYIRKGGVAFWVLMGFVLLEPERRLSVAFVVDIDEKKRTEQALVNSEERFASLFRKSPVAVAMAELTTGRIIDVNDECCALFGYERRELIGQSAMGLGLWEDSGDRDRLVALLRKSERTASIETRMKRRSGERFYALVSMAETTLPAITERISIVTIVDTTDRRELESQLMQSQKMEAIGRLAGGVAHDFNNMLGVILGVAELLQSEVGAREKARLAEIVKAAKRAAGLTKQLLAFSRRQVLEAKVLNLNRLVTGIATMLQRLIGEDIRLETNLGSQLGNIKADAGQIEQVIMNLAVNARDAMPAGGVLRISTANTGLDESVPVLHGPIIAGRYVMLSVADNGAGMEEETRLRLFEPFFTTKERGKGTGLGLSTVYGIVRQSAGYVWVSSELGVGTTFKIYFPCVDETADAAGPASRVEEPTGTERILLAEDEPPLRAMISEVLAKQGYRVTAVGDGRAAIESAELERGGYELLITDVVMPGMSGTDLAAALTERYPELLVLFVSGYAAEVIPPAKLEASRAAFLSKPFTRAELLERVRRTLDAKKPLP